MTNIPDHKVIVFNNQKITINPKQRLISVNILECYNIAIFEIGYTYGPSAFVKIDEQTYVKEKYLREFCEDFEREYIDVFNLRTNVETMSSLQIAELTGKRHDAVMRDIKNMLEQLNIQSPQFCGDYKDSRGRTYPCYNLNEELTLTLTSGYSVIQRNAIIKEWQAHRRGGMMPTVQQPAELSRKDLLLMALKSEEEKERLQFERDEAVRCKSWISESREASVMGKLARANDKIKWQDEQISQLEAKLSSPKTEYQYATVLAVQSRLKHLKVSGLKLTYYCNRNGLIMKDIPDDRYGVVHSYPAQAWRDVYQIDINNVLNKVA